jgi:hypothetical protein
MKIVWKSLSTNFVVRLGILLQEVGRGKRNNRTFGIPDKIVNYKVLNTQ